MKLKKLSIALLLAAGVIGLASCAGKQNKTTAKDEPTNTSNTVDVSTTDTTPKTTDDIIISTKEEDEFAKYKVSKELFNSFFKLDSFDIISNLNVTIDITNKRLTKKAIDEFKLKVELDKKNLLFTDYTRGYNYLFEITEPGRANVYVKEGKGDWFTPGKFSFTVDELLNNVYLAQFDFSSFTFDEATKSYKSTKVVSNKYDNGECIVVREFSNVVIKFEDNQIVSFNCDMKENEFDPSETVYTDETAYSSIVYESSYSFSKIGETVVTKPEIKTEGKKFSVYADIDGNGTVTGDGEYSKNEVATLTATADTGYVFAGWYVNDEFYSTDTTIKITVDDNIDVVAVFELELGTQEQYDLLLDANDGTGEASATRVSGNTFTLPDESDEFYRENYTLIGWSEDPYSDDPEYEPKEQITIDYETQLYAIWQGNQVTFTYICPIEGAEDLLDSLYEDDDLYKSRYGELFTLPSADAISYGDYILYGWTSVPYEYGDGSPSVEYCLDEEYLIDVFDIVDDNIELYPLFYTFKKTVVEPTLEYDGKIINKCIENDDLTTEEKIKKETIFAMYIDDSFTIQGRGLVLTGKVKSGVLNLGDEVSISDKNGNIVNIKINGIEMFKKQLESCQAGDNVGLLVEGINQEDVKVGSLMASKGKIIMSKNLLLDLDFIPKEQGGKTNPVSIGYRPQMFYEVVDATIELKNAYDLHMNPITTINPGDSAICQMDLVVTCPVYVGQEIAIREGGRTVATGKIIARTTEQIEDVVNNQVPITVCLNNGPISVYDIDNKIVNYKRIFVNKDAILKDVLPPFERNGYNFIGYSVPNGNMEEVSASKASDYTASTIYCCWEEINDASYDLYVTDFRSVNEKHSDYSLVGSDGPIKKSFSVGDSITIYKQDGTEYTGTISNIIWYSTSVETVSAGSKYVKLEIADAKFAKGASYGDVVLLNE